MHQRNILLLLIATIVMTSCGSPSYKNGKKFYFHDNELKSTLVYFCQNKSTLPPMLLRAEKAHVYFMKENNKNTQMLIDAVGNEKKQAAAMQKFQKAAETLALKLHRKFSCTLIDTIDN